MASPSLQQRARRFLDEDAGTFAFTSLLGSSAFLVREFRAAAVAQSSSVAKLQLAMRKTLPVVPAIVLSSAVGIVGIKLTLAAVQEARRDYSRTSVLLAVPLFAGLMHAPGGPRTMAKAAVGYGALILAVDYAAFNWHRYNAMKLELEEEQAARDEHHDWSHLHDSDVFIRQGLLPDAAVFRREPAMLGSRFGEK